MSGRKRTKVTREDAELLCNLSCVPPPPVLCPIPRRVPLFCRMALNLGPKKNTAPVQERVNEIARRRLRERAGRV